MKITCPYCGNLFEDSHTECPHCNAPNDQRPDGNSRDPSTIEELQKWYSDRHLPPYEKTRFFIGENVKELRAFGIYRDGKNVIVYKNKDNGQRAIRYQGSDEAHAVSEIFLKLKEEILQQKQVNFHKKNTLPTSTKPSESSPSTPSQSAALNAQGKKGCLWGRLGCFGKILVGFGLFVALLLAVSAIWAIGDQIFVNPPEPGYYYYDGSSYAFSKVEEDFTVRNWFVYDGDWEGPLDKSVVPEQLQKKKNAKNYLVSKDLSDPDGTPSLTDSEVYRDWLNAYYDGKNGNTVSSGYYNYNGNTYYHLNDDANSGWYSYGDNGWSSASAYSIPDDLLHSYYAAEYFSGSSYDDDDLYYTDFTDTDYYDDYVSSWSSSSSSSSSSSWGSSSSSSSWDDDDDDWSWDDDDDWDSDYSSSDWDSDW